MLKNGVHNQELAFPDPAVDIIDVEISEGKGSDIKVFAESVDSNVKTTKDGKIILCADDPDDPLNWTWTKKSLLFASLIMPSFLTDFGMTFGL